MAQVALTKRIILDVLKPLQPNALEFARHLAEEIPNCRFIVKVAEVDRQTESLLVEIIGDEIHAEDIYSVITKLSATVHSIDEVEVESTNNSVDQSLIEERSNDLD
jgi:hypothetical protein